MNGNRKKDNGDHSFFILCIGQAFIRIVHYNFNADIPQLGLLKVFKGLVWNYTPCFKLPQNS